MTNDHIDQFLDEYRRASLAHPSKPASALAHAVRYALDMQAPKVISVECTAQKSRVVPRQIPADVLDEIADELRKPGGVVPSTEDLDRMASAPRPRAGHISTSCSSLAATRLCRAESYAMEPHVVERVFTENLVKFAEQEVSLMLSDTECLAHFNIPELQAEIASRKPPAPPRGAPPVTSLPDMLGHVPPRSPRLQRALEYQRRQNANASITDLIAFAEREVELDRQDRKHFLLNRDNLVALLWGARLLDEMDASKLADRILDLASGKLP